MQRDSPCPLRFTQLFRLCGQKLRLRRLLPERRNVVLIDEVYLVRLVVKYSVFRYSEISSASTLLGVSLSSVKLLRTGSPLLAITSLPQRPQMTRLMSLPSSSAMLCMKCMSELL